MKRSTNHTFGTMKSSNKTVINIFVIAIMTIFVSCSQHDEKSSLNVKDLNDSESTQKEIKTKSKMNLYQFKAKSLEGSDYDFSQLKGKKVIILNTASECGFTPQYKGFQELYDQFGNEKFEIIGFPCNQFGAQEPGSAEEIGAFCSKNYGVTFPIMEKIDVKGDNAHPIYQWLTSAENNGLGDFTVKWNFQKFLISEDGNLEMCLDGKVDPLDERILSWLSK